MPQLKDESAKEFNRLIIVSNRLPFLLAKGDTNKWQITPSSGGLVAALAPILQDKVGLWIGWAGSFERSYPSDMLARASKDAGYTIKPIVLSQNEIDKYYLGFSNETIWPLFHDLPSLSEFDPSWWAEYQIVNNKFAQVIAESSSVNDFIWVHDYHLMLVARELRNIGVEHRIGFFLHTPFPPIDLFRKLPQRAEILRALLEYDLIGFQTMRDRNNFIWCVQAIIKGLRIDARRRVSIIETPTREIKAGVFPISIDFNEFIRYAEDDIINDKVNQILQALPNYQIILGVDRLDYSKGIPLKLKAIKNVLERFHELRGKITLIQIVVPSREDVPEYQRLKIEIEQLVGEINGKWGEPGWTPIQYMFRNFTRTDLIAYYRAASMALVTPTKDGMNLVAKEYCATNIKNDGVLILSEFAGAARQLYRDAILVNPYDIEGVANAIHRAYNMSLDERKARMRRLRNSIQRRDIYWWLDLFFRAASGSEHI
jgi:trehalose 6-phosphate synthase